MAESIRDSAASAVGLMLRMVRTRPAVQRVAPLPTRGFCHSCGRPAIFLASDNRWLVERMKGWPYDGSVLNALATRENYPCLWCGRNFRMRKLAAVARPAIARAVVYEPATFGVFTKRCQRSARAYVTSEYINGAEPGATISGHRHEDIRVLTFDDNMFDVVITSELFEHVDDPWRGFAEVRRVLRVGGRHFFTVPHIADQPTRDRNGLTDVYHIDPMKPEGILVKTDFGEDLPAILARYGFHTRVHAFPRTDPVARVYESCAI